MTHKEFTKAYEREDHLGGGGFGQVFKAYDIKNDRYVAVKRSEVKPEFKDFTLMREYELAKEIPQHPNICPYENCFRFNEGFIDADYAILKYYEYGNISEFLEKQTLSDREKKQLIKGILLGVEHLHKNNIIHRDLKAGNILIDREDGVWRPKITDFGLSKITDRSQITKSLHNSSIGVSFHYAAPEQIEGAKSILPNVDLWAVGVLIYQVFSNGNLPFTSDHPETTIAQTEIAAKVKFLEFPDDLNQITEPYQSIIRKCWVKDIHQRVQKAADLLEKLESYKKPPVSNTPQKPITEETTILGDRINIDSNHTKNESQKTERKCWYCSAKIITKQDNEKITLYKQNNTPKEISINRCKKCKNKNNRNFFIITSMIIISILLGTFIRWWTIESYENFFMTILIGGGTSLFFAFALIVTFFQKWLTKASEDPPNIKLLKAKGWTLVEPDK